MNFKTLAKQEAASTPSVAYMGDPVKQRGEETVCIKHCTKISITSRGS